MAPCQDDTSTPCGNVTGSASEAHVLDVAAGAAKAILFAPAVLPGTGVGVLLGAGVVAGAAVLLGAAPAVLPGAGVAVAVLPGAGVAVAVLPGAGVAVAVLLGAGVVAGAAVLLGAGIAVAVLPDTAVFAGVAAWLGRPVLLNGPDSSRSSCGEWGSATLGRPAADDVAGRGKCAARFIALTTDGGIGPAGRAESPPLGNPAACIVARLAALAPAACPAPE
jgi:hypothetical protein